MLTCKGLVDSVKSLEQETKRQNTRIQGIESTCKNIAHTLDKLLAQRDATAACPEKVVMTLPTYTMSHIGSLSSNGSRDKRD